MANLRLKISKKTSGTYQIQSLSIKQLRELSKMKQRRWNLSKDGKSLNLEAEEDK